jgi:hypothetical protein
MQGNLFLNLEPTYIGFQSDTQVRSLKYCSREEVRNLLLDLKLLLPEQALPKDDCIIKLWGNFPADVLAQYGLAGQAHHLAA